MLEIVQAGGFIMLPIIACSIVAVAIVLERLWTLQRNRVLPGNTSAQVWSWIKNNQLDPKSLQTLHQSSPLGQILAVGVEHRFHTRDVLKEAIVRFGVNVMLQP